MADDQTLAGRPVRRPASKWLLLHNPLFASEKRCGLSALRCNFIATFWREIFEANIIVFIAFIVTPIISTAFFWQQTAGPNGKLSTKWFPRRKILRIIWFTVFTSVMPRHAARIMSSKSIIDSTERKKKDLIKCIPVTFFTSFTPR